MNYAHLHLILNHIPVLGIIFGLLILIYGFIRKSDEVKQTALGIFILAGLMVIPVYLTGEPSEETVEHLAGVSEALIEQHEAAALFALILTLLTGIAAFFNLLFFRYRSMKKFVIVTAFISLLSVGAILRTANLGGQIRHTEIRSGAVLPAGGETEADEDDD